MYSASNRYVLGFHGCDKEVRDRIVIEKGHLVKPSKNDYDWLGHGAYFWENDLKRAEEFAKKKKDRAKDGGKNTINNPVVLGAVIDLGYCLDLLDSKNLELLTSAYKLFEVMKDGGYPIPENTKPDANGDPLIRKLDCAVIEAIHSNAKRNNDTAYDTVRAVFFEGQELYPDAGFRTKNHIQIAVRNPNCIKGYFIPRSSDKKHHPV